MNRPSLPIILNAALLVLTPWMGLACHEADRDLTIVVAVSPKTVNLESQGVWVTVHADIPYRDVARFTVTLNGIAVTTTKSDDRGDLVAKFNIDDVKKALVPGTVVLTLAGTTTDGESFSGSDTIQVIDTRD
jgi:hypothetical protein